MNRKLYLYSLFVWGLIGVLTVTFGIFREAIFIPLTGLDGTIARIILVPVQIAYVMFLSYLLLKKTEIDYTQKDLWIIGLLWLILTIGFEFFFGYFIMGHSFETLLNDFNVFTGRVWLIFLITIFLAPLLVNKFIINKRAE